MGALGGRPTRRTRRSREPDQSRPVSRVPTSRRHRIGNANETQPTQQHTMANIAGKKKK